jgi:hypothetical protein
MPSEIHSPVPHIGAIDEIRASPPSCCLRIQAGRSIAETEYFSRTDAIFHVG